VCLKITSAIILTLGIFSGPMNICFARLPTNFASNFNSSVCTKCDSNRSTSALTADDYQTDIDRLIALRSHPRQFELRSPRRSLVWRKIRAIGEGYWYWDIPWHVITRSGRNITLPSTVRQLATADANGTAVISKGASGESRIPSNSTTTW